MSKWIIYLLLALSLGLNVGVIATTLVQRAANAPPGPPSGRGAGERHEPGPPPDPGQLVEAHLRGMTRHLELDQGQQEAIRALMEHHAPQLIRLQSDVGKAGRRLADAFAAPTFDPKNFHKLTIEAGAVRARLDSLSAVLLVAEAAVLTPEQRLKFSEVAPTIHSSPQGRPRDAGPPPGDNGRSPREGEPPPR